MSNCNDTLDILLNHRRSIQAISYLTASLEGEEEFYPVFYSVNKQLQETYSLLEKKRNSHIHYYENKIDTLNKEIEFLKSQIPINQEILVLP